MKNWKTSVAGILAVLPQVLHLLFPNFINDATANAISIVIAASGLVVSKDFNVSGNPPTTIEPASKAE